MASFGSGASTALGGRSLDLENASGSCMAEMMALFTPPGRDSRRGAGAAGALLNPRPVELHPYFKRPGKGHNHDCCDACGEGGDLICCDHCPASFHFSCHAPPLEEEDIPIGDWMCLRCYVRERSRQETIKASSISNQSATAAATSSSSTRQQQSATGDMNKETQPNTVDGGEDQTTAPPSAPKGRARSTRGSSASAAAKKQQQQQLQQQLQQEKKVKLYKLKYDKYLVTKPKTNSPFDALIAATQVINAEQFKLPLELESSEILPFSWKWSDERAADDLEPHGGGNGRKLLCFVCAKSSRNMPAVACDFCPNVYHLDCLDPPLCEVPSKERWMCPAHVEHAIDSKLVTSTSLTERLRLWNKYARGPVDTDAIRLDFFRKARRGRLYQRCNLRTSRDDRVKVPQYVKAHYRNPQAKHPQILSSYSFQNLLSSQETGMTLDSLDSEREEFLCDVISLQNGALALESKRLRQEIAGEKRKNKKLRTSLEKNQDREIENNKEELILSDKDHEEVEVESPKTENEKNATGEDPDADETDSNCSVDLDHPVDDTSKDPTLSKELLQALNEYLAQKRRSGSLETLSPAVRDFLALQRLREIFPATEMNPENEVQARAALLPLHSSSRSPPVLMRYRTLQIGSGSDNDLDLDAYSGRSRRCRFVSSKHAVLYFDQHSQTYEMINYSEHGTAIDGSVYALATRRVPASPHVIRDRMNAKCRNTEDRGNCGCQVSLAEALFEVRKQEEEEKLDSEKNASESKEHWEAREACENSALLRHGSHLRFGCLQFVFSVTEYTDSQEEKKEDNEKVKDVKEEVEHEESTKEEPS